MSTFNTAQMQTDAMLAPIQMEAGRRRNEGIQYIGQAAAGAAQQFQQAQNAKQQLDIADAESAARISGWMQDQQLNAIKVAQTLQLDQVMQSRYGTTMVEMQAREMKLALDQKESAMKADESQHLSRVYELALMRGLDIDEKGKMVPFKDNAERDKAIERFRAVNSRLPTPRAAPAEREASISQLMNAAQDAYDNGQNDLGDRYMQTLREREGLPAKQGDNSTATKKPDTLGGVAAPKKIIPAIGAKNSEAADKYIRTNIAELTKAVRSMAGDKGNSFNEEQVVNWLLDELRNVDSPIGNRLLRRMLNSGLLDVDEIRQAQNIERAKDGEVVLDVSRFTGR